MDSLRYRDDHHPENNVELKVMNDLLQWLKAHPVKGCAFTSLFSTLPVLMVFKPEWLVPCLSLYGAVWLVWVLVMVMDLRRLGLILLLTSFLLPASAQEKEPAPVGAIVIGTVVIVVGGVCIYKVVKFCQRKFPKRSTNAPPAEFHIAGEPGEYGAAFMDGIDGSCAERQLPSTPTVFTLCIEASTNLVTTMRAEVGEEHTQNFWDFQQEMAEHGLSLWQGDSYARNRHPTDAEDVPIVYDRETGVIKHGKGGLLITVERCVDLRDWEPLLKTDVQVGTKLEIPDMGAGAAFYRVTAEGL